MQSRPSLPSAASALELPEDQEAHRREELEEYDDEPALSEREDEAEGECLVIERFLKKMATVPYTR